MPRNRQHRQRISVDEVARQGVAVDEATRQGKERFDARTKAIFAEIQALLNGRLVDALSGAEVVRLMALRAEFDGVSLEQERFTEAVVAELLNPGDGGELVE